MSLINAGIGGLGASTILGGINNKLLPAAILWIPTGSKIPKESDAGKTEASTSAKAKMPPLNAGATPPFVGGNKAPIEEGLPNANASQAQSLLFTCVESEAMEATATVSNFPVDSGFNVSDHTFRNNPVIKIQGVVSNTEFLNGDFTSLPSILKISGAILKSPLGGLAANAIEFGKTFSKQQTNPSNVEHFHTTLEQLVLSGQLVQVVTLRGVYANCVITGYSTMAAAESSSTLKFSLTLERVNVVTTKNPDGSPSIDLTSSESLPALTPLGEGKVNAYLESIGIGVLGTVIGSI